MRLRIGVIGLKINEWRKKMIYYDEYLQYEKNGFEDKIHPSEVCEKMPKMNVTKCNDMFWDNIIGECEVINIYVEDEDEEGEEVENIMCSEDYKFVIVNYKTNFSFAIEEIIDNSKNLKYLSISNLPELPNNISTLKKLRYLEVKNTPVENRLAEIYEMVSLEALVLDYTNIKVLSDGIHMLKELKMLSVMQNLLSDLPRDLGELEELRYLGLNGTKIVKVPESAFGLKRLKSLYLGQTEISELPEQIKNFDELEHLAIWETNIEELPEWIGKLKKLKGLYMGRAEKVCCLPESIGELENLEVLYLDGTNINKLPQSFKKLTNLKKLTLNGTKIQKFPELNEFPYLKECNLSDMVIERVPREVINDSMEIILGSEYFEWRENQDVLILRDTKLLCQPISLFSHEKEFIYAYYEEEKIHLNESKIVFLGDGEAGKSHIIKRILQEGNPLEEFREGSTPGIAISAKECCIDEECVKLQIWDFGGQEIMHSMHRFFLTERTVYVIVVNARDNTQDERAQYWLNNIKSFANGCPVIVVLNKMDQNPSATLNERLLKHDYPQIANITKMSALTDSKANFQVLMNKILKLVRVSDSYAMDFPISWNRIKKILSETEKNYIVDSEYREICKNNSVEDEQIQDWLLDWFHDLGVSFNYHRKDYLLGGYMILKPNWITNAIYIILFNGRDRAQNGIISIADIIELLKHPPKAVSAISYSITEIPYILGVMRRFEISYSINGEKEFIPMMCDRNQHEEAESFLSDECLEYFMQYEYLPNNVLHKLMIKMKDDLVEHKIWLTGMLLNARNSNISALVRMHGKKIEIYIKSKDARIWQPKEYLSEIREFLLTINKELNLIAEDTIVYKEDGKVEEIKYQNLLIHLSGGQKEYFSPVFCKLISIKKLLGLVEDEWDIELILQYCKEHQIVSYQIIHQMLVESQELTYQEFEKVLIESCMKLQGNSLQILKGNENDRNTYLRDLLSANKRFEVNDQTLNGLSAKGKAAGELDLLIKDCHQIPFAVLEGLNLPAINKKYLTMHINKIFQYDTWGLPNNYIIVYAATSEFVPFCKRYKKFLEKCNYMYPLLRLEEKEGYADICLFDTILQRNEVETTITHIIIKMHVQ